MKTILFVDSGYLRKIFSHNERFYNADGIDAFSHYAIDTIKTSKCKDLNLLRILFYDCVLYSGIVKLPISGESYEYKNFDYTMKNLAAKDFFAIRHGELKFRGWDLKKTAFGKSNLTDDDFAPIFEQKGVDMRVGLDISKYAYERTIDQIILLSNDTDYIPAMKLARSSGLKVSLMEVSPEQLTPDLKSHADTTYPIPFPTNNTQITKFQKQR